MTLSAHQLLYAYANGVFPMALSRESTEIQWVRPKWRGIIPLHSFHISRSLARSIKRAEYSVKINSDFSQTVFLCAHRDETWINDTLFRLYKELHQRGYAHSLEIWQNDKIIGGVFGIALGGSFFGESMFSRKRDASKIALSWLIHRLIHGGFDLFDTQFITPHLETLGAIEVSDIEYQNMLQASQKKIASFRSPNYCPTPSDVASLTF